MVTEPRDPHARLGAAMDDLHAGIACVEGDTGIEIPDAERDMGQSEIGHFKAPGL
jgi:hypothetical protein